MIDGLDMVEVIMEIEDYFRIQIPDALAEKFVTWGDLHRYVVQAIGASDTETGTCLSRASFHVVRDKLAALLHTDAGCIRPSTRLEELLPIARRRELWAQVARTLAVPKYCLGLPQSVGIMLLALASLTILAGIASRNWMGGVSVAAVLLAMLPIYLSLRARYGTRIPAEMATVGQMASLHMLYVMRGFPPRHSAWTANQVWQVVRHLVAVSAGVPVQKVRPQARITFDLM